MLRSIILTLLLSTLLLNSVSYAKSTNKNIITKTKSNKANTSLSIKNLAKRHVTLFDSFVANSLSGKGKKAFNKISNKVKVNIRWLDDKGTNDYNEAFRRSYPFVANYDLKNMPESIFLLSYMESQWQGKRGRKEADYGYWQMVPEVLNEIKTLPYLPKTVREGDINAIRENKTLSTQAAQAHLHRYHFYFNKVAKYSNSDSWLLTFTAFNWGAGNVKRLMEQVANDGLEPNYSNFYYYLYQLYLKTPNDRSMRAAVEYVPKLWHMAHLIAEAN
jgi:hypothetical protein